MKISRTSQGSSKTPSKGEQSGMDHIGSAQERSEEDQPQVMGGVKVASIAWAIAAIVWAIAVYLIEREKQRAQVELARLAMETKKQVAS